MTTLRIPVNDQFTITQEKVTYLINILSRFDSSVIIHDQNRMINAKSLLGILSLGYPKSGFFEFVIEGPDEAAVRDALLDHFQRLQN